MVPFLFLLLLLPYNGESYSFKKLQLPIGSESYAFDSENRLYTSLNDGRILKFQSNKLGFVDFATTSPNRSKELCDGRSGNDLKAVQMCGRPVGLDFNYNTGELYIVDAFRGLMVVRSGGGVATQITGGRNGVLVDAPDAIGIDPITGVVYFTDVGTIFFKTNNMTEVLLSGDSTGRLLKYDPTTKQQAVVLTGLAVPNGVAVSKDGSFVLIAQYLTCIITRLWLKGSKSNTSETFANLPGNPDNIKRTKSGDFWVPANIQKLHPKLTSFPLGQKINVHGKILETVNFYAEYNSTSITEVQEHLGSLYVASVYTNFGGVYKRLIC